MAIDPKDKSFSESSTTSASGSSAGASSSGSQGGANEQVQRVAQGAHKAVDRVEETLTQGSEKLMAMQHEYGEKARERVTSNPLGALGIAFVAGIVLSEVLLPSGKRSRKQRRSELAREAKEELRHSRSEGIGRGLRRLVDLQHGPLHGLAESASHAAHRLERGLGHGGDRLVAMQHEYGGLAREYGGLAREQIKAHPLVLIGVGVGVCAAILKLYDESR